MSRLRGASRRARLLLFVAAGLFALLFGVVVPVPRIVALRFSSPSTTAFLEARRESLLSAGKDGRIDRRPVPLEKVSPHLVTAVLVAEDARFFEHHGIDWDAVKAARARNRRYSEAAADRGVDDHPAARQEPLALPRPKLAEEGARGGDRPDDGAPPPQARDPRPLPLGHRMGREGLRVRGGVQEVLRGSRLGAHAASRRRGSRR